MLAKAPIRNYTKPQRVARRSVHVVAPYAAPPARVRAVLELAARQTRGVLADPEPSVVVDDFTERGVDYWVRFFIRDFEIRDVIAADVRERLWYALRRAGWEIPPPQRHVALQQRTAESLAEEEARRVRERERAIEQVDFLAPLPDEARHQLAELAETQLYAPGETIILQGALGDELFVVQEGEVSVVIGGDRGAEREVAVLGPGKFFGEMSLMTGEPRRATVRARTECEVLVVSKPAFQQIVATNEPLLESISQALSVRDEALGHAESDEVEGAGADRKSQVLLLGRIKRFFSL
jgi:CRP-like cAMP-binding protein